MQSESRKDIIILDIDGTVVDTPTTYQPTYAVKQAIKKAQKNFIISLATGRPWRLTKDVIKDLGIKDPIIVLGGTEIVSPDGKVLWEVAMTSSQVDKVLEVLKEYQGLGYVVDDYSFEIYLSGGDYDLERLKTLNKPKVIEPVFLERSVADEIEKKINKINGVTAVKTTAHKAGYNDVHIMSSFATKEHAIAELLKITQIDVDRTTGVGDGHNDIHLFNAVRHKVAMGNAVPELKKAADRVIGTVREDGLALYLEERINHA